MKTVTLAVPTKGSRGMRDTVADVFARANNFTIVEIVDCEGGDVRVEENPASDLKQGAGPIVAKNLKEKGVDVIVAGEIGPGATTLLKMSRIRMIRVTPGVKVSKAVKIALKELGTES